MREYGALLHNMSAPPKTVVKYGGLCDIASRESGTFPPGQHPLPLPGVAVRFSLPVDLAQASASCILLRLSQDPGTAPDKTLARLIDERAAALPMPDGCAAIPVRPEHRILWPDPLSALAVLAKCSAHVWLRVKTPSLAAAIARPDVSLLIPPAFAARLPKESP
jgi:hypothetical protein